MGTEWTTGSLLKSANDNRTRRWKSLPLEDVNRDPRFIAHKCAFDRRMILHISAKAVNGRGEAEDDSVPGGEW